MLKNKRIFLIIFAVLVLVALFVVKKYQSGDWNKQIYQNTNEESGLTYENVTVGDLVNQDTDGDGIPDWQESLYGLDPTKKETTPGIPDSSVVSKQSAQNGATTSTKDTIPVAENLTQTEKFSRELFATVAAASQNGAMDQTTIDQLGATLAEKIKNPSIRKVFLLSDIKIISDDTPQAIKEYGNTAGDILKRYPIKTGVLPILQKFMGDETNFAILLELNPITNQMNKIIEELIKMNVPQSISLLHLDFINSLQRVEENVEDMKLFEKDIIVALSGINQFEKNIAIESVAFNKLTSAVMQIE
ncbi:MAG: thrombospondin type 3 repeat-containing protein [bacterium]